MFFLLNSIEDKNSRFINSEQFHLMAPVQASIYDFQRAGVQTLEKGQINIKRKRIYR